MPVRVTVPDAGTFVVEDLTLDEVVAVERETGDTWVTLNPLRSAVHARAIMVRFLARTVGEDEARRRLGGLRVADVVSGIERVPDDDRPQEFRDGMPVVDPKADGGAPATT